VVIVEGLPKGIPLDEESLARHLARRQRGYGRGPRMQIERDRGTILAGVRYGRTLGSPLAVEIRNRDWDRWAGVMDVAAGTSPPAPPITRPRPGHADLPGMMKYRTGDMRDIIERSSARETAARVVAGAVAEELLRVVGVSLVNRVTGIGPVELEGEFPDEGDALRRIEESEFFIAEADREKELREEVDRAAAGGDTLGGTFQILARGLVPGLGSHVHWDRRLDGRVAQALMSIQGIKGVEIGIGFRGRQLGGLAFHDAIHLSRRGDGLGLARGSNRAGGVEGGMTNGEPLVARAFMKPIPTTRSPLPTVDLADGSTVGAHHERSDVCAVPAASVVGRAMTAVVLADAYLEKFGGDTVADLGEAWRNYRERLEREFHWSAGQGDG
jgi:chorismate synthase